MPLYGHSISISSILSPVPSRLGASGLGLRPALRRGTSWELPTAGAHAALRWRGHRRVAGWSLSGGQVVDAAGCQWEKKLFEKSRSLHGLTPIYG